MIRRTDLNGDVPIRVLLEFLKQEIEDKHPRKIGDVNEEFWKKAGKLELIDLIESLCKKGSK